MRKVILPIWPTFCIVMIGFILSNAAKEGTSLEGPAHAIQIEYDHHDDVSNEEEYIGDLDV